MKRNHSQWTAPPRNHHHSYSKSKSRSGGYNTRSRKYTAYKSTAPRTTSSSSSSGGGGPKKPPKKKLVWKTHSKPGEKGSHQVQNNEFLNARQDTVMDKVQKNYTLAERESMESFLSRLQNRNGIRIEKLKSVKSKADKPTTDIALKPLDKLPSQGSIHGGVPGAPAVNAGKQGKHVLNHPNSIPKKSQWPKGENGVRLTQEAWMKGKVVKGDGSVKTYDFKSPVGPNGETRVKVHRDKSGELHGYPKIEMGKQ